MILESSSRRNPDLNRSSRFGIIQVDGDEILMGWFSIVSIRAERGEKTLVHR